MGGYIGEIQLGSERELYKYINHYVCVCVFFPSILDIKFVGRTSRGHTGVCSSKKENKYSTIILDGFLRGNFSRKFWGWRGQKFLGEKKRADARKRYTTMVPRHKGVIHMNTP